MHYLGRYTIVFNGELYNYRELKEILQHKGYQFRSQSDTEVILACYDAWGVDCLQQFDGMFAFAIWDEKEQMLFAARDRFGEKPFYYYRDKEQLLFSSEMKGLWAAGVEKKMNERMLFNYITLGYIQNPQNASETFYEGIQKLAARCYLLYDARKTTLSQHSYWDIDITQPSRPVDEKAAIEQLGSFLSISVNRRLRSDVPVGTSLSGGWIALRYWLAFTGLLKGLGSCKLSRLFFLVLRVMNRHKSP